jgi:hypothetical protein
VNRDGVMLALFVAIQWIVYSLLIIFMSFDSNSVVLDLFVSYNILLVLLVCYFNNRRHITVVFIQFKQCNIFLFVHTFLYTIDVHSRGVVQSNCTFLVYLFRSHLCKGFCSSFDVKVPHGL